MGYLRFLERPGTLTRDQRSHLESISKACGRLNELIEQMSILSKIEEGKLKFERVRAINLRPILAQAVSALPELADRDVRVTLATGEGSAMLKGDSTYLTSAFAALFDALRRELVTSNELQIRERLRSTQSGNESWIVVGPAELVAALESATAEQLDTFDEWRGGIGMRLPIARRVIEAHGGRVWQRVEELEQDLDTTDVRLKIKKKAAVVMLPIH